MLMKVEEGDKGGRWSREEALTLLELRTTMDSKFTHTTQKSPLWDELSRILEDEYGYKRSGKKCREKLENLYKYYKKTKHGKVGKCNSQHYRFFTQLDALYGDQDNNDFPTTMLTRDLSFSSNSSEFDSSSSEDEVDGQDSSSQGHHRGEMYGEEFGLRELMEMETKKLVELHEAWLDKILKTMDKLEQERISKEESRRREEASKFENEQRIRMAEQTRVKVQNEIIMQTLERISTKGREATKLPFKCPYFPVNSM